MKKNQGFNQHRTFGVELEFFLKKGRRAEAVLEVLEALGSYGIDANWEGYTHRTTRHWKLVYDASVSYEGLELVSPVLQGQAGLEELNKATQALQAAGAKVDRSCGVHVHHGAEDFNLKSMKNLYGIYTRYEDCLDGFFAKSRRRNNAKYCRGFNGDLESIKQAETIEQLLMNYRSKYSKLNMKSYRRQGTIEFRQHQGTTDYEKLESWIVMSQMMMERSRTGTIQLKHGATDLPNFKKVIRAFDWMGADELQQKAVKFMSGRRKALASS